MFSPTVTELPRRLESISRDTFNDAPAASAAARLDNVIELFPAAADAHRPGLAAA